MERTKYVLTSAILLSLLGLTTTGCDSGSSKTTIVSTNQLVFSQQPPATAVAGQALAPEIVVSVVDDNGTVNTTITSPITISLQSSNGATLSGTATANAVAGVARFADLRVDRAGTSNTLVATSARQVLGFSAPFTVTPGAVTQLRFVNAVNTGAPSVPLDPIQIELLDAAGNRATGSTQAVTMSIVASNGAILGGATIIGATNGICTFSSLTVDRAGSYQLIGTGNSISTTSATFAVSAPASPFVGSLTFATQPGNSSEGGAVPSFTVELRDNFGALLTSASNPVTLNLGTNPGGSTLTGALTVSAVNGVATFSSVILDRSASNYRLTASVGGFNDAVSNTFNVAATTARSLAFVGQPANVGEGVSLGTVTVQIQNSSGAAANAANPVTISLGANPGGATLSGTLTVVASGTGLATFSNLSLDRAAASYTLTATSGGLPSTTSAAFTISPSTARRLGFIAQPTNVGEGQTMGTVTVAVQDSAGGTVTTAQNVLVTLQLGSNPTRGALGGTLSALSVNGIATFSNLSLSQAGAGFTLTAASGALTPASSSTFDVTATTARQLAFVVNPTGALAGSTISPAVTVEVRDANGVLVTGATNMVTLLIGTNTGGGALRGTVSAPATGGVATFSNLSIDRPGAGYQLLAISGSLTPSTSTAFTITGSAGVALRFFNAPANVAEGSAINVGTGVTVEIIDSLGARVTSATNPVTIQLGANPGNGILGGTLTVTASSGLATFSTLRLDRAAAGYSLTATSNGLSDVTSGAFDVTAATARQLAFGVQPTSIAENGTINPAMTVLIQDALGNTVTTASNFVTLHVAGNPGGSTLRGTVTVQAASGVATFPGVSLDRAANSYILGASSPGLTGGLSGAFNVTPALSARRLVFTVTPAGGAEGGTFTATAQIQDSGGALITGATNLVTIALGSNPTGGTLSGPQFTVAAVGGVATFNGLSIDKAGTFTLSASGNGLDTGTSLGLAITPGAARELRFGVSPSNVAEAGLITPPVTVRVTDTAGNTITTATNLVSLDLGSNPAAGTLSGTVSAPAINGVATFGDLSVNRAGLSYTLRATSGGLTPALSTTFNVSASTARSVAFNGSPLGAAEGGTLPGITVQVRDSAGVLVTGATNLVTLQLGRNTAGGTLKGTLTVAAVGGQAQFNDLSLDRAGSYTLRASAGALVDSESSAFTITASTARGLVFSVQPGSAAEGGTLAQVSVTVVDATNAVVATSTNRVTLALASNAAGGTLSGTTSVAAAGGVANFANLSLDRVGSYTLLATADGLNGQLSGSFTITPGLARRLGFTVNPPASAAENNAFAASVVVAVQDSAGNTVTTATNPVTLVLGANPGAGTLTGTLTVNAVSGLATFPGLAINRAGVGYSLTAFSGALTSATSTPVFTITGSSGGTHLDYGAQPTDAPEGSNVPAFTVRVLDATNAVSTTSSNLVTVQLVSNTNGALLSGTSTRAAASGIATFNDIRVDRAGTYRLLASSSGLTSFVSDPFTITASTARQLAFNPGPAGGGVEGGVLPTFVVEVRDSSNAVVTTAGNPITLSIADNPAGGTLSGTLTANAASGLATFSNVVLSKAGSYRLLASSNGLTGALTATFTVNVGAAHHLAFVQEPTTAPAGAGINPAIRVVVLDSANNPVNSATNPVTLQFATNPGGATLGGPLTVNATAGGQATFTNVRVDKTGVGYQLLASSPGLTGAVSATFNATGALAHHLTQAAPAAPGGAENASFTVNIRVEDVANNPAGLGIPVTLVLANNPNGATLSGTTSTTTDASGIASFSVRLNKAGTGYTLLALSQGLPTLLTNAFDIIPSTAVDMVFAAQPSAVAETQVMSQVQVQVRNAVGGSAGPGVNVTLLLASNQAGALLTGTLTVPTDGAGLATFTDLRLDRAGTGYRLLAVSGGLPSITSGTFAVTEFTARSLLFTVQPATAVDEGDGFSATVQLRTATGDAAFANVPVTIDLASNPGGGALKGTLTVNTNASGAAVFSGSIDRAGAPYQLRATSAGLTAGLSSTFTVTPALARRLAFTANPVTNFAFATLNQPGGVQVQVQDSNGDPALGQSYLVTLVLGNNTPNGVLSGTLSRLTNPATGVAAFTDLVLNLPANGYTFTAFASGLTPAVSTGFNILGTPPSAGTHLGIVQNDQPRSTPQAASITNITSNSALQVEILDIFNNRVAAASGAVTVQLGSNPANGILSGTLTVNAVAGVATFPNLTIDKVGTGYRLTFSTANLVGVTSDPFNITPSLADHLVFPNNIASPIGQNQVLFDVLNSSPRAIVVQVVDQGGTAVTDNGIPVTLAITTNPATPPGALSGTTTRLTVNGVATFNDLSIDRIAAGYVLTATANGLGDAQSSAFNITPTTAASVRFLAGPTSTDEGAVINAPGQVTVELLDHLGNVVVVPNVPVTLAIDFNVAAGVMSGTLTQLTDVGGVARFNDLSIDRAGAGYTLRATSGALGAQTSGAFTINPTTPHHVDFLADLAAGQLQNVVLSDGTGSLTVRILNGNNGLVNVTGLPITVAITTNGGTFGPGTLHGTYTRLTTAGVAVFNDLSIDNIGTGYRLTATSGTLIVDTTAAFDVGSSAVAAVRFTTPGQPGGANENAVIPGASGPIQVEAVDQLGAHVAVQNVPVTVTLDTNPTAASAILRGTLTELTDVNGFAHFTDLRIDQAGGGYVLRASSAALIAGNSNIFQIDSSTATQLVFSVQPADAGQNVAISTPTGVTVALLDANNNLVTQTGVPVTLHISANPGAPTAGILAGTTTVNTVGGFAAFPGLSIQREGVGYRLTAASGALPAQISAAFDITPTLATQLSAFTPAGAPEGVAIPDFVVQLLDSANNAVSQDLVPVTLALDTNPSNGVLRGTLTVLTNTSGQATFTGLSIDQFGSGYTFRATAGGLTGRTSGAFTISPNSARGLVFVGTAPVMDDVGQNVALTTNTGANGVRVQLVDGLGANFSLAGVAVTASIGTQGAGSTPFGVLAGTTTVLTDTNGVATFADLSIGRIGTGYSLLFTASGLGTASSDTFNITATTATQLLLTGAPGPALQNATLGPLTVQVQDAATGNVAVNGLPVTIAITTNGTASAVPGTLRGTTTKLTVAGLVTFNDLSIDNIGAGYVLTVTADSLTPASTAGFAITPSTAAALRFAVGPPTGSPNDGPENSVLQSNAGPVQVEALDQLGAPVGQLGVPVTLTLDTNSGAAGAILRGTLTAVTDATGVASFNDLRVDQAGSGYVLRASSGALTAGQSSTFTIDSSTATALAFTVQPADAGQNVAISGPTPAGVQVELRDANDDPVLQAGVPVTLHISTNPGAPTAGILAGTTTVLTDVNGQATFPGISIQSEGLDYQLTATSGALLAVTSGDFDITPTLATQLSFIGGGPVAGAAEGVALPSFVVELLDSAGNDVNLAGVMVTIAIDTNGAGGVLTGTLTVATDASGDAPFSGLSIGDAGSYVLRATAGGLTSTNSSSFSITPNSARALGFVGAMDDVGQSVALTSGANPVQVQLLDALGAPFAQAGVAVTAAIGSQGMLVAPFGALAGTTTVVTDSNGVATFSNLSIDQVGTNYSLLFTASGLGFVSSDAFDITATTAVTLAFLNEPADGAQNTTLLDTAAGAIRVRVLNASNNLVGVTGVPVTIAISQNGAASPVPGPGTLRGTLTVLTVAGLATFTDLSIDNIGDDYQFTVTSGTLAPDTSADFDIGSNTAAAVRFLVGPPSGDPTTTDENAVLQSLAGPVQVEALDQLGAPVGVANIPVTLTLGANPNGAGAILRGTLTALTDAAGVARFNDLRIDQAGNDYVLRASSGALVAGDSSIFSIDSVTATQLAFLDQPELTVLQGQALDGAAGAPRQLVVEVRDANGVLVNVDNIPVTLALTTNHVASAIGPGSLRGTTTRLTVGGVATFDDLTVDNVGTGYRLTATAGDLFSPESSAFAVTVNQAVAVRFRAAEQPTNTPESSAINPATGVVVELLDQANGVIVVAGVPVTVGIGAANPGGGTLRGTLTVQTTATGEATFSGLAIDRAGVGYVLRASAQGLTSGDSASFDVIAAVASSLAFVNPPATTDQNVALATVTVELRDANGLLAPYDDVPVTLHISTNPGAPPGVLGGTTTVTTVGGVASFPGLTIGSAGAGYQLTATAGSLLAATSGAFDINQTLATRLAFTSGPNNSSENGPINFTVELQTTAGAGVNLAGVPVTVAITTNPASGVLSGTLTVVTDANGDAIFTTPTINRAGVGYVLRASAGSLTAANSAAFSVAPNTPARLVAVGVMNNVPQFAALSASLNPVRVQLVDSAGNNVALGGVAVTAAISTQTGPASPFATLAGSTTVITDATGLASFSTLSMDRIGSGYGLLFTSGVLQNAHSTAFDILPSAARALDFFQTINDANENATLDDVGVGTSITVRLLDHLGVPITASSTNGTLITIGLATNPGSGVLGGTLTRQTVAGEANFNDLRIDRAAIGYALVATCGTLVGDTSSSFTINAVTPSALFWSIEPAATTTRGQPLDDTVGPGGNALRVHVRNSQGVLLGTDNTTQVTIVLGANPASGVLGGTLTQTATGGVVDFSDLSVSAAAAGYRLTAFAGRLTPATTGTFTVTGPPSTQLVIRHHPGAALVGPTLIGVGGAALDLSTVPAILVGAHLPGTLSISIDPAGLAPATTIRDDGHGRLLSPFLPGGGTVDYSTGALTGVTVALDLGPVNATREAATGTIAAGVVLGAISVEAITAEGLVDSSFAANVIVQLGSNPGSAVLGGLLSKPAIAGQVTFSDLTVSAPGTGYALAVSSSPLAGMTGAPFNVGPSSVTLAFGASPTLTGTAEHVTITPAVTVQTTPGTAGIPVTLRLSTIPTPGGALDGTTTVVTNGAGLASFGDLRVNRAGTGYTLTADANGLASSPASPAFDVAATVVTFSTQPVGDMVGATLATGPVVRVVDGAGNLVTGEPVTLVLGQNPPGAVLGGNTVRTTVGGLANFSDLHVNLPGNYRVWALVSGQTPVLSDPFTVSGSPASGRLMVAFATTTTEAGDLLPALTVQIRDILGNPVTTAQNAITLVLGSNPSGGVLRGTITKSASGGSVVFDDLRLFEPGLGYQITATAGGFFSATTGAFDVTLDFASAAIQVGDQPTGLGAGHLTGNGFVDLVTANLGVTTGAAQDGTTTTLRGTGAGGFSLLTTAPGTNGLRDGSGVSVGADITNSPADGLDAAVSDAATNAVLILGANGAGIGLFGGPYVSSRAVATGYFQASDLNADVAAGDAAGSAIVIRDQVSNTTVVATTLTTVLGLDGGDVDGDGVDDLVAVGAAASSRLVVLLGNGAGAFAQTDVALLGSDGEWVELFDLDGDSDLDALVTTSNGDIVGVFNDGAGSFSGATTLVIGVATVPAFCRPGVGDVNGDGLPDLLVPSFTTNEVLVHLGTGSTTTPFTLLQTLTLATSSGPVQVVVADLDQTGGLDVAVTCQQSDEVQLFRR